MKRQHISWGRLIFTIALFYYYFNNIDEDTGAPKPSKLKNRARKATDEGKIAEVKKHINSFPVLDSHYCRASSQKKYLESHLIVARIYALYKEQTSQPVSVNVYRHVLITLSTLPFTVQRRICTINATCTKTTKII